MVGNRNKRTAGKETNSFADIEEQIGEMSEFAKKTKVLSDFFTSDSGMKNIMSTLESLKDSGGKRIFSDDKVKEITKKVISQYNDKFREINSKIMNKQPVTSDEIKYYLNSLRNIQDMNKNMLKDVKVTTSSIARSHANTINTSDPDINKKLKMQEIKAFVESVKGNDEFQNQGSQNHISKILSHLDDTKTNDDIYMNELKTMVGDFSSYIKTSARDKSIDTNGMLIPQITGDLKKLSENLKVIEMGHSFIKKGLDRTIGKDYNDFSAVIKAWSGKSAGDWSKTLLKKITGEKSKEDKDKAENKKNSNIVSKTILSVKEQIEKMYKFMKLNSFRTMATSLMQMIVSFLSGTGGMIVLGASAVVLLTEAITKGIQAGFANVGKSFLDSILPEKMKYDENISKTVKEIILNAVRGARNDIPRYKDDIEYKDFRQFYKGKTGKNLPNFAPMSPEEQIKSKIEKEVRTLYKDNWQAENLLDGMNANIESLKQNEEIKELLKEYLESKDRESQANSVINNVNQSARDSMTVIQTTSIPQLGMNGN